jgi:hypothetical protein
MLLMKYLVILKTHSDIQSNNLLHFCLAVSNVVPVHVIKAYWEVEE